MFILYHPEAKVKVLLKLLEQARVTSLRVLELSSAEVESVFDADIHVPVTISAEATAKD